MNVQPLVIELSQSDHIRVTSNQKPHHASSSPYALPLPPGSPLPDTPPTHGLVLPAALHVNRTTQCALLWPFCSTLCVGTILAVAVVGVFHSSIVFGCIKHHSSLLSC